MPPFGAALCRGGIHPSLNHGDSPYIAVREGKRPPLLIFKNPE